MKKVLLSILIIMLITPTLSAKENRVALIQSAFVWGDTKANIAAFNKKISKIKGCDLIILPELFISGCDMQKRDKEVKDSVKHSIAAEYSNIIKEMQTWAKESGAVIIGSTIYENNNLFYNRLLAVYPSGEYYHYDKHNCFKRGSFSPGNEHLVITVNGHKYATYICYDLRFSEWSKNNNNYDTAIYIANWPESRGTDWHNLLSQRALENNAHVIGVNCVGREPGGINFIGESAIYLPDGSLKAKCIGNKEQILIID